MVNFIYIEHFAASPAAIVPDAPFDALELLMPLYYLSGEHRRIGGC